MCSFYETNLGKKLRLPDCKVTIFITWAGSATEANNQDLAPRQFQMARVFSSKRKTALMTPKKYVNTY